jgi:hypothetical protein
MHFFQADISFLSLRFVFDFFELVDAVAGLRVGGVDAEEYDE